MTTREEIKARIAAVDASELDEHRKFAIGIQRVRTCRKYVEDCCEHPETKKVFQIGHFDTRCVDCGKLIKDEPCNPSSPS